MPPALSCVDLRMKYPGTDAWALGPTAGVSFGLEQGELFALLGPSGCGKTTTLRIIGGFIAATEGRVLIGGRDVTRAAPYDRPTNTVFQSYALFPHMSVEQNVAFGLKAKRVPRRERERRVREALELVGLHDLAGRKSGELSGGQAQRAALARALVNRPQVLLLDEPLGALDLKLRRQMQEEIVRLKAETDTSLVHVTHDQEEACAMADRIAVMAHGEIVQVGSPIELYRRPRTSYVAEFIRAGTVIHGASSRTDHIAEVHRGDVVLRGPVGPELNGARAFAAVLPPTRVRVAPAGHEPGEEAAGRATGTVERLLFTGSGFDCHIRIDADLVLTASLGMETALDGRKRPEPGERAVATWRPEDVIFVEEDTPGPDGGPQR